MTERFGKETQFTRIESRKKFFLNPAALLIQQEDKILKEVLKFPLGYGYLSPEETQKNRKAVYRFLKKVPKRLKKRFKMVYL